MFLGSDELAATNENNPNTIKISFGSDIKYKVPGIEDKDKSTGKVTGKLFFFFFSSSRGHPASTAEDRFSRSHPLLAEIG